MRITNPSERKINLGENSTRRVGITDHIVRYRHQHQESPLHGLSPVGDKGPDHTTGLVRTASMHGNAGIETFDLSGSNTESAPPRKCPVGMQKQYKQALRTWEPRGCPVNSSYFPFAMEHLLVVHVQKALKESIFDFVPGHMPEVLQAKSWTCANQGELNVWCILLSGYFTIPASAVGYGMYDKLQGIFKRIHQIHYIAPHRFQNIPISSIQLMLKDAVTLTRAFRDTRCHQLLSRLLDRVIQIEQGTNEMIQRQRAIIGGHEVPNGARARLHEVEEEIKQNRLQLRTLELRQMKLKAEANKLKEALANSDPEKVTGSDS